MKNYILDTNVLLYDPNSIEMFEDNNVYIPLAVLEELDTFKKSPNELGSSSRKVIRKLDKLREKGKLCNGVDIGEGKIFVLPFKQDKDNESYLIDKNYADNKILLIANQLCRSHKDVILVTKDINLRIKADALGIEAEDYKKSIEEKEVYSGVVELKLSEELLDELYLEKEIEIPHEFEVLENQYVIITPENAEYMIDRKTMNGESYDYYVKNHDNRHTVARCKGGMIQLVGDGASAGKMGRIRAKNTRQEFVTNALMDKDVKLVTIEGNAGTGKTIMAVASAMAQYREGAYNKITITRPIVSVGKELGYLPGDVDSKMTPWMQPILDALDVVSNHGNGTSEEESVSFDEETAIQIAPLSYIRGRNIANSFMIIDEAQNLSPHEMKTIITRAGENTKIVITGDTDQIDIPFLGKYSNGFSYLIRKFKGEKIFSHITLKDGERSNLAKLAADLL